jgi:hypothetical protein
LFSVPLPIGVLSLLFGLHVDRKFPSGLYVCAALPLAVATWLASYRLRIDDSGIEYRNLSKSFKVAYSEIKRLRPYMISTGHGPNTRWILRLSDGRKLTMNLTPLARTKLDMLEGGADVAAAIIQHAGRAGWPLNIGRGQRSARLLERLGCGGE